MASVVLFILAVFTSTSVIRDGRPEMEYLPLNVCVAVGCVATLQSALRVLGHPDPGAPVQDDSDQGKRGIKYDRSSWTVTHRFREILKVNAADADGLTVKRPDHIPESRPCNLGCPNGATPLSQSCISCTPIANCEWLICNSTTDHTCHRCNYTRGGQIKAYQQVASEGYPNRVCEQRCSWRPDSKFCFPGRCPGTPSTCTCAPGYSGDNCLTISRRPAIAHCLAKLQRVVGGAERDTLEADCGAVTATSTVYVGRHIAFNRLQMTWNSIWTGLNASDWPQPDYINDFRVGIVTASSTWRLVRGGSALRSGTIGCRTEHSRDNPDTDLHDCVNHSDLNLPALLHGDSLEFKAKATNGGYIVINNHDRSDGVVTQNARQYYEELEVIHTGNFTYDLRDPVHCSVASMCSSKLVEIGPSFTKNGHIQIRWPGWSDEGSGLGKYEYTVYILQAYGDDLGMRSVTPVLSGSQNMSGGASMARVTLTEPGTYCFLLTVDDVATNYQRARRFLIYDNVNNVTVDTHQPLWADSAAVNTTRLWQTDLQDSRGTGTKVEERRWREKINEHTCCPRLYKTHETNRRPHMLWYIAKKNPTQRENQTIRGELMDDITDCLGTTVAAEVHQQPEETFQQPEETFVEVVLGARVEGEVEPEQWPGRYQNLFHHQHKLLAAIEPYDPPIAAGYEIITGQPPQERSRQAIPNAYGVTKVETAFAVDHSGGRSITSPPNTWTTVPDVRAEGVDLDIPRVDGDSVRLWVRAYDVVGNSVQEEILLHVDSSPPVVQNFWLNRHGVPALAVHHSSDLFTMRFEFEAFDDHSGLHNIHWSLQDFLDSSTVHGEGQVAVRRPSLLHPECPPPDCACIPKDSECYFRNYEITPDLSKMDIPVGSHDHDYVFVVTVTNNAMLVTTVTFQVTVDESPPTAGQVQDAMQGQRDLDFQQDLQLHAWWDGFFDRESGVQFYQYGFANRCLGEDEFSIPQSEHIHNTTGRFGSRVAPVAGTYFCTVVAYNPALTPSQPACSDGVTVDASPPSVRHVKLTGFHARPGLVSDDGGNVWIMNRNGEREVVTDPPESCRNASRHVKDIELWQIAEPPYKRNITSQNCTELGPLPDMGYLPMENHHQGQARLPVCGCCSAPRTGMFTCAWMVFSTKDMNVHLFVDGVQHQGQECSPVCGWCSAPRTGMFTCVWMVFSTKDKHLHIQWEGWGNESGIADYELHVQWEGWDDESGIADYEVGLSSTKSATDSPDIHPYTSTKSHPELTLYHPNLAQGALFYIVIRATNRPLLSTTKVFGPVTVDITPPVMDTHINVMHTTFNAEDFLVAVWPTGSVYDTEDLVGLELEVAAGHSPGGTELSVFAPVKSFLQSNSLCTIAFCVALPMSQLEWHLHGNQVYYVTLRVTNSAGLTSTLTSTPYHHNVELPSDISYQAGVGSGPGLDDVVTFELVGSSMSHVFTGLSLEHFQLSIRTQEGVTWWQR
ncbi:hypothetical protein Bbelb_027880 [Branchiostoma belcheri]|nr:hypothetical protein Bbelb_027880 [Branchiostoma belcheri]